MWIMDICEVNKVIWISRKIKVMRIGELNLASATFFPLGRLFLMRIP